MQKQKKTEAVSSATVCAAAREMYLSNMGPDMRIFQMFIKLLDWFQGDGRKAALFTGLASAALLATAYFFEYVVRLLPCYLCYWERKPHMALIALGLVGFLISKPRLRAGILVLMMLAALGNAGLAFFHVGVEYHWWVGLPTCSAPTAITSDLESARQLVFESTVVPCDKAAWIFLGVSMAGWNGIVCLFMAAWTAFAARRSWKLGAAR